jgi:hypothetical protein
MAYPNTGFNRSMPRVPASRTSFYSTYWKGSFLTLPNKCRPLWLLIRAPRSCGNGYHLTSHCRVLLFAYCSLSRIYTLTASPWNSCHGVIRQGFLNRHDLITNSVVSKDGLMTALVSRWCLKHSIRPTFIGYSQLPKICISFLMIWPKPADTDTCRLNAMLSYSSKSVMRAPPARWCKNQSAGQQKT